MKLFRRCSLVLFVAMVPIGFIGCDDDGGGGGGVSRTLSIADAEVVEGDSGTSTLTFVVTISSEPPAGEVVSVDWATADGTAAAGEDYTADAGTFDFTNGGATTQQILVTVSGDTTAEPDQQMLVDISTASTIVTVSDAQGAGTIENDEWDAPMQVGATTCVTGMAVADTDGDNAWELFTADWSGRVVNVWSYDSSGSSMQLDSTTGAFAGDVHGIVVGDFDEDGDVDIVASLRNMGVSLCKWDAAGGDWDTPANITAASSNTYGHNVSGPYLLNADAHLDFIANQDSEEWIYYGVGDGTFTPERNPIGADAADPDGSSAIYCRGHLFVVDLDGDTDLDLVGTWCQGGWNYYPSDRHDYFLRGFLNLGDTNPVDGRPEWGVSAAEVLGHKTGDNSPTGFIVDPVSGAVGVGDFDEDGLIDITVTDTTAPRHLLCLGQDSGGTLDDWSESQLAAEWAYLFVADVNGDGHDDIVSGGYSNYDGMRIRYGKGDGTFVLQTHAFAYGTGTSRCGGVAADFNGDGLTDIATSRYDSAGGSDDGAIVVLQDDGNL